MLSDRLSGRHVDEKSGEEGSGSAMRRMPLSKGNDRKEVRFRSSSSTDLEDGGLGESLDIRLYETLELSPFTLRFLKKEMEERFVQYEKNALETSHISRHIWFSRAWLLLANEMLRVESRRTVSENVLDGLVIGGAACLAASQVAGVLEESDVSWQAIVTTLCALRSASMMCAPDGQTFVRGMSYAMDTVLFGLLFGLRAVASTMVLTLRFCLILGQYLSRAEWEEATALLMAGCLCFALGCSVRLRERAARAAYAHHLRYLSLHNLDVRGLQNPFSAPNLVAWVRSFMNSNSVTDPVIHSSSGSPPPYHRGGLHGSNTGQNAQTHSSKRFSVLERWELDYERLRIIEKIGAGAAGHVYKGEYLGAVVAIKQLYSSFIDPSNLEEFSREVTLLHQLKHPHVLTFYGISRRDVYVYIVMEYCPFALDVILAAPASDKKMPRLSIEQRIQIAYEVALALEYLHAEQVLHRDLKPGNILLNRDCSARVSDFGVSQRGPSTRDPQRLVGTPAFTAPELISNECRNADFETMSKIDIFAFGVVLAAMFAPNGDPYHYWRREHPRRNSDPLLMRDVAANKLRPRVPSALPTELRPLTQRCWDHSPHSRPRFKALKLELREYLVKERVLPAHLLHKLPVGPDAVSQDDDDDDEPIADSTAAGHHHHHQPQQQQQQQQQQRPTRPSSESASSSVAPAQTATSRNTITSLAPSVSSVSSTSSTSSSVITAATTNPSASSNSLAANATPPATGNAPPYTAARLGMHNLDNPTTAI